MTAFTRKVATRYFRSRRGFVSVVTGFSLVGITLGVAALIVVMAVMAGFRGELLDRILGTTGHAQLSRPGLTLNMADEISTKIMKIPGVISAQPFIGGQGMVVSPQRALGGLVRGLRPDDLRATKMITSHITMGALESFKAGKPVAVLGEQLAQNLGVRPGDSVNLLSPQGSHTVLGFMPRMMQVRVVALFNVGMYQYDSALLFLPIDIAQKFYKTNSLINGIEVMVERPDEINRMVPHLATALAGGHISTWVDANRQFFSALQVERVAMFIILMLIVLVAAFNIITGQMMLVNQKRRDIAILRTMGARRRDILRLFLYSGFSIGLAGTAGGLLLGFLVVWQLDNLVALIQEITGVSLFNGAVYFLDKMPTDVLPADVIMVVVMSLGLSLLASIFPAWRATRLDPVEALRNE